MQHWGPALYALLVVALFVAPDALAKRRLLVTRPVHFQNSSDPSLKTQKELVEQGADLLLYPASNVKLVTSLAALAILKPDYRFKAEYYASGPIENGVLKGDLIVKGYGDPSIVTGRLQHVARELELRGIKQVTGRIVLDDSYFDAQSYPAGWEKELDNSNAYAAPVGALSLNHNAVTPFVWPTSPGAPAFVALDPPVYTLRDGSGLGKAKRPLLAAEPHREGPGEDWIDGEEDSGVEEISGGG